MIKEIKFGGLSASPSDYEAPEGDLAAIIGAVPETGSISPVLPPRPVFMVDTGSTVAFVHETAYIRNYIIRDSSNHFTWRNESGDQSGDLDNDGQPLFSSSSTIHQVNAIGNTIVILSDSGMHYFLWKGSNDGYLYLGNHMPELSMSFGLQGEFVSKVIKGGVNVKIDWNNRFNEFSDSVKDTVSEKVLANVNDFIVEESIKKGKFIFPFLVRYAYRLYDGTLAMHSSPILILTSNDAIQIVNIGYSIVENGHFTWFIGNIASMVHDLDYSADYDGVQALENWKDIIKSVDIFISKPIYTYDQNGKCDRFEEILTVDDDPSFSICKQTNQVKSTTTYPLRYQMKKLSEYWDMAIEEGENVIADRLHLPHRPAKDVVKEIESCHMFYLLSSIAIQDLKTDRTVIHNDEDIFQSIISSSENETDLNGSDSIYGLETREFMTDDYESHDVLFPKYSYSYNSRLNLINMSKILYKGPTTGSSFMFTDGYVKKFSNLPATYLDRTVGISVYFFIRQEEKDIVTRVNGARFGLYTSLYYIYHPNKNAYKAVVVWADMFNVKLYEVPLKQHDTLNGAYYFDNFEDILQDKNLINTLPQETDIDSRTINIPNKIYTSEVNNPFYFPVTGINTINAEKVISIRSAAKALSQGQFGQFPLYAFTSEGVWALEVNSAGGFSAKQPITRDVCINPDSITQLDDSVLFATDRGIMLLSGSSSTCISEILDYQQQFNITSLPHIDKLMQIAGVAPDALTYDTFHNFLLRCRMLYAYNLQRIIVYSTKADGTPYPYAYVYSLKSKQWGMMPSNITSSVPSYPEALAMTKYAGHQDCTYVAPTLILLFDSMYESIIELEVIKATDEDITFRVTTDVAAKIVVFDGKFAVTGQYKGIALLSSGDTYTIKAGESKAFASTKGTISERNSMYSISYDENNVNRIYKSVTVTKGEYIEGNQLVDYSSIDPQSKGNPTRGMFITRPLKLDMPDVLKTVDTVIQRGNFRYGHVKSAIYGSRDLVNWIPIWTSTDHFLRGFRGNPYRYFRILSIFELDSTESIFGASVQYTPRFQNRLR